MRVIRQIGSTAFVAGLFVAIFGGMPWHVMTADDPAVPWWLRIAVFCLLGGILVVLATVAIEQRKSEPGGEAPAQAAPEREVMLLNAAAVPGREITESLGLVQGHTVFAIWLGQDLSALLGADAIINVRYMTTSVVGSAAELLVYGTAVKLSA